MNLKSELHIFYGDPSSSVWRVSKGSMLREDTICLTATFTKAATRVKEYTFFMLCDEELRKGLDLSLIHI